MNPSFTMGQVATSRNAIQQSTMGNAMQQFRPQLGQQSFYQFSNFYLRNSWNVVENKTPERQAALQSVGYNSFASPYSTGGNYNMASMTSASR